MLALALSPEPTPLAAAAVGGPGAAPAPGPSPTPTATFAWDGDAYGGAFTPLTGNNQGDNAITLLAGSSGGAFLGGDNPPGGLQGGVSGASVLGGYFAAPRRKVKISDIPTVANGRYFGYCFFEGAHWSTDLRGIYFSLSDAGLVDVNLVVNGALGAWQGALATLPPGGSLAIYRPTPDVSWTAEVYDAADELIASRQVTGTGAWNPNRLCLPNFGNGWITNQFRDIQHNGSQT